MNEIEDGIYRGLKWRNRQSGGWLPVLILRETFYICICLNNTVKPVLSGHSKIGKTKVLKTNGSLMKVESIAECSPWSILQYF